MTNHISKITINHLLDRCAPDPNSGCWIWLGQITKNGYGKIECERKEISTHRLSHFLTTGENPEVVAHKCDNPSCINPNHLFSATHKINVADKVRKNRQAKGVKINTAKLNYSKVKEIRISHENGASPTVLARIYGVNRIHIYRIINKKCWNSQE
jgi:hypothetical protein